MPDLTQDRSVRREQRTACDEWCDSLVQIRTDSIRAAARAATQRNAAVVQRVDDLLHAAAVWVARAVVFAFLVAAAVWVLLAYAEPCAAGSLCMLAGLPWGRRSTPEPVNAEGPASASPQPAPGLAAIETARFNVLAPSELAPPLRQLLDATDQLRAADCRVSYVAGWRWGLACGVCLTLTLGALGMAAAGLLGAGL